MKSQTPKQGHNVKGEWPWYPWYPSMLKGPHERSLEALLEIFKMSYEARITLYVDLFMITPKSQQYALKRIANPAILWSRHSNQLHSSAIKSNEDKSSSTLVMDILTKQTWNRTLKPFARYRNNLSAKKETCLNNLISAGNVCLPCLKLSTKKILTPYLVKIPVPTGWVCRWAEHSCLFGPWHIILIASGSYIKYIIRLPLLPLLPLSMFSLHKTETPRNDSTLVALNHYWGKTFLLVMLLMQEISQISFRWD